MLVQAGGCALPFDRADQAPQTAAIVGAGGAAVELVHDREETALAPKNMAPPVDAVVAGHFALHEAIVRTVQGLIQRRQRRHHQTVAGRFQNPDAIALHGDGIVVFGGGADVVPVGQPGAVVPGQPQNGIAVLVAVAVGAGAFEQQIFLRRIKAGAQGELVEIASVLPGVVRCGDPVAHPAPGRFGQGQKADAEQIRRRVGFDAVQSKAIGVDPHDGVEAVENLFH